MNPKNDPSRFQNRTAGCRVEAMRKVFSLILAAAPLIAAGQTHVWFNLSDFNANPTTNRTVTLQRMQPVIGNLTEYTTGTNGYFYASNLLVGDYDVVIRPRGQAGQIAVQVTVTDESLGIIGANTNTSVRGVQTYPQSGRSAWTIASSDGRYLPSGRPVTTNDTRPLNLTNSINIHSTNAPGSKILRVLSGTAEQLAVTDEGVFLPNTTTDAAVDTTILGRNVDGNVVRIAGYGFNASGKLTGDGSALTGVSGSGGGLPIILATAGDSQSTSNEVTGDAVWTNYFRASNPFRAMGSNIWNGYAVSGRKIQEITNGYPTEAGATKPATGQLGWLFVYGGVNSFGIDSTNVIKTGLSWLWSTARADGYKVCAFTISPHFGWGVSVQTTECDAVNTWIRTQTNSFDALVDVRALIAQADTIDNLHYTAAGAKKLDAAIKGALMGSKNITVSPRFFTAGTAGVNGPVSFGEYEAGIASIYNYAGNGYLTMDGRPNGVQMNVGAGLTGLSIDASGHASFPVDVTGVGTVQRLSPVGGWNNIYLDMLDKTPNYDMQVGVARDNSSTALWFSKGNSGVGSNSWGMPLSLPGGVRQLGNASWIDLTNSTLALAVGAGWYCGFGTNEASFQASWPNGYGFSTVQPFFTIASGNPWMTTALAVRAANTNGGQGRVFQGYTRDSASNMVPVYLSQYGINLQDFGDAIAVDNTELGGQCYQGRPYGSTMILLDEEKNFYITMNGRRTGDSYNGQIPFMVFDVLTQGKTNPIFRIPQQRANAWVPPSAGSTNWVDAFYVNSSNGVAGVLSNLFVGGAIRTTNNIISQTANGSVISADYPGYSRLGIMAKSGQYPKIAAGNGSPIIFTHSDSGGLDDATVGSQTQTDRAAINSDGTVDFYYATAAASLTATNYIAMKTNYVASRYTPIAGKVKICVSNNVMHTVTMTKTNILTTFDP